MKSDDLKVTQDTLTTLLIVELIGEVYPNYDEIIIKVNQLKEIDKMRRISWNEEKFDPYEKLTDEILNNDFSEDDIPF